VGASAGATLIGLLFVAITLGAGLSTPQGLNATSAFLTPTLILFGGVLLECMAVLPPWPPIPEVHRHLNVRLSRGRLPQRPPVSWLSTVSAGNAAGAGSTDRNSPDEALALQRRDDRGIGAGGRCEGLAEDGGKTDAVGVE
jgi:hypothetical protein